jgi:hypothetical protein
MAPLRMSSMLGCVAAVVAIVSPSHPSASGIHRMWTSLAAGSRCFVRPLGPDLVSAMRSSPFPRK